MNDPNQISAAGPVDWIVVEFPGSRFNGQIAPALRDLVQRDLIRVLDMLVLKKDADGSLEAFDSPTWTRASRSASRYEARLAMLLSEDDVVAVANAIEPGSSAAVLVWENSWAAPFASAVRESGGQSSRAAASRSSPFSPRSKRMRSTAGMSPWPTQHRTEPDMPLAARRMRRAAVIGPAPWPAPRPPLPQPPWSPMASTGAQIVGTTAGIADPAPAIEAQTRRMKERTVMAADRHARTMLPIPDRPASGLTTYDAKDPDTAFPPIEPLLPPEGAPNVLIVLVDDVGFGASSAFGGPCQTPIAERLAAGGLRYNRFHTTALCAPTRQALLTGRNHHSVGMGSITETATSAPGNSSLRPNTKAPLAMTLKLNGYSTAQFGKCHEVPVWQSSPMGPFDAWPSGGGGFEKFYGFIGGENNQWDPALYDGTTPVEPPATPEEGYHLTEDLTDQAVGWIRQQKALMPDKPFFVYFSLGATHAPHHVPKEWADRYAGQFDDGWDVQRERTFARQKELGVIPAEAELTARHDEIPAWDDMPDELKPVLARQMEVYAGFLEHTDHHVGRLIDTLEDLEILDDTLIYYIIGDNGASAEGTLNGAFNELANFNGMAALETPEFMMSKMDEFGSPSSYNHYSVGWAWAMDTPFQWTKQVASHWGGTRNGTIVHWPSGHRGEGRAPLPVHPRHRPGADDPGGSGGSRTGHGQRCAAGAHRGHQHAVQLQRGRPRPSDTTCSTSRCSATAGSTTEGWSAVTKHRTPWVMVGGTSRRSTTTCGSCTTAASTTARPTTCPPTTPRCSRSCSGSGSSRPPSTTCCRSTTAAPSASSRPSRAARP